MPPLPIQCPKPAGSVLPSTSGRSRRSVPCATAAALIPPFGTPCSPVFVTSKRTITSSPPRAAGGMRAASRFDAVVPSLMPCAPPVGVTTTRRTPTSPGGGGDDGTDRKLVPARAERHDEPLRVIRQPNALQRDAPFRLEPSG